MELKIYKDKPEVARQFSEYFVELVKGKDIFHVALSGGSTPKVIFDILAKDYGDKIDWSKIHFYWGDERCVPPTDNESNYKMTVDHLFSKINVPRENIHRVMGEFDAEVEAARYSELLESDLPLVNNIPTFDLVLLGMGDDGHTASIFPHEINLWHSESFCVVATHPVSGQKRVSISGKIINAAKEVTFLVTGANKAEKIDCIHNRKEGYRNFPAALVEPMSGKLIWLMDEAAADVLSS